MIPRLAVFSLTRVEISRPFFEQSDDETMKSRILLRPV